MQCYWAFCSCYNVKAEKAKNQKSRNWWNSKYFPVLRVEPKTLHYKSSAHTTRLSQPAATKPFRVMLSTLFVKKSSYCITFLFSSKQSFFCICDYEKQFWVFVFHCKRHTVWQCWIKLLLLVWKPELFTAHWLT